MKSSSPPTGLSASIVVFAVPQDRHGGDVSKSKRKSKKSTTTFIGNYAITLFIGIIFASNVSSVVEARPHVVPGHLISKSSNPEPVQQALPPKKCGIPVFDLKKGCIEDEAVKFAIAQIKEKRKINEVKQTWIENDPCKYPFQLNNCSEEFEKELESVIGCFKKFENGYERFCSTRQDICKIISDFEKLQSETDSLNEIVKGKLVSCKGRTTEFIVDPSTVPSPESSTIPSVDISAYNSLNPSTAPSDNLAESKPPKKTSGDDETYFDITPSISNTLFILFLCVLALIGGFVTGKFRCPSRLIPESSSDSEINGINFEGEGGGLLN